MRATISHNQVEIKEQAFIALLEDNGLLPEGVVLIQKVSFDEAKETVTVKLFPLSEPDAA